MVGVAERGPITVASMISSISMFETVYGTRQSYSGALYDAARTYFEEGGPELWVGRVVGTTPVVGSFTFPDRATSPLPTLKVSAKNPGAWSSELSVQVAAGAVAGVTLTVYRAGALVETWSNYTDVASLTAAINGSGGVAVSQFIVAANLASVSAGSLALPAIHAAAPLAGGDDNRSTITATTVTNGLALFPSGLGVGAVMAPGYSADLVGTALIAHSVANSRVALMAGPVDAGKDAMIALAGSFLTNVNAQYAGLFGPWVTIPDGTATRVIDPVGAVAGLRAKAINTNGFWAIPAGDQGRFQFVNGTAWTLDEGTNQALAAAGVSGIVTYSTGPELFGWFGLEPDGTGNMVLLSNQDSLNSLSAIITDLLHPYVWRTVDGSGNLLGEILGDLQGTLQTIANNGGLYARLDADGNELDPGYSVTVDATLNPTSQLASNAVKAAVGVRFSPAVVDLLVALYQSGLSAAV